MPQPADSRQRYVPGLDGLRAVAVLAVIAYHVNLGWAQGGLLGVGVFFTLSGYLITDLLMAQQAGTGHLGMVRFWQRRARRLLPALFVMLAVVAGWVSLVQRGQLPALRGATLAAVGYVSNWWLTAQSASYFARFGPPSTLGHLWSLAVEEQFYLIWPWLLLAGLILTRSQGDATRRRWLAGGSLLLAAVSAILMAVLYHPGYDPTRIYDGTDTRAFALLIGAALAFLQPSRLMPAQPGRARRLVLDGAGAAGLIVIGLLIWRTGQYSPLLYRGGMVLLSLATAAVVLAVVSPAGRIGRVLGWRPLRWVGVRSYAIYLWHYPIIVLTTPASGQETLLRGSLQVAATVAIAALSWTFIEEPIRHGAIGRWLRELRAGAWQPAARRGWVAVVMACWVLALAIAGLAGVVPGVSAAPAVAASSASVQTGGPGASTSSSLAANGTAAHGSAAPAASPAVPLKTSCRSVVHFGDSTSDGLVSSSYLPDPAQRINAQYADVGVIRTRFEIQGGTSIVETILNEPNAYTVAQRLVRAGYRGCWVLALGTNDTADVAVGSNVGLAARIQRMMSVIHGQPVLWVNVRSLLSNGPYAEKNMQQWDRALLRTCRIYPNMRVLNWADLVQRPWYISDGIHFTSAGYVQRSALIAGGLAEAFPQASSLARLPGVAQRMLAAQSQSGCLVY
jgi:peptidoglycan/LPS O-acetylase OafA/YrhL